MHTPVDFKLLKVDSDEGFRALRRDWNQLLAESEFDHIQLTHDWLLTAWRHYRTDFPDARLQIFCLHTHEGLLVAIFPLMIKVVPFRRFFRRNQLCPLCFEYADVSGFVIRRDWENDCIEFFVRSILAGWSGWDTLLLRNLVGTTTVIGALRTQLKRSKFKFHSTVKTHLYAVSMDGRMVEDYTGSLSKSHRQNLRSARHRLSELSASTHTTPVFERCPVDVSLIERVLELGRKRRKLMQRSSILDTRGFQNFLKEFALSGTGEIEIFVLRAGSQLLAISLCLLYGGTRHYWIPAFDDRYQQYSPGVLLLEHLIRQTFDEGLRRFDFMAGDSEYKKKWNPDEVDGIQIRATNFSRFMKSRTLRTSD